ncbi:MAG: hypothetical protein ACLQVD_04785 [Capsulimonadaceae bacterium]
MSTAAGTPDAFDAAGISTAAYRLASDGSITEPHPFQVDLYERLANGATDAGLLVMSPTGAGRTEGIIIPSLGLQRGGAPRRVLIVVRDGCPLDDYVVRLHRYLKAWAAADEVARTVYVDEGHDAKAIRYTADGLVEYEIATSPLEADVDVVLTSFERFLDLFFGSGGVHGLPSALKFDDTQRIRRDLFFFDEAQPYAMDRFAQFLRLVEFLFARDADIIVGSSTLPEGFAEELSFLEKITVQSPPVAVNVEWIATDRVTEAMAREAADRHSPNGRIVVAARDEAQAGEIVGCLPVRLRGAVTYYGADISSSERRQILGRLRAAESSSLVVTTGAVLQGADLDFETVITGLCLPEHWILRAGRCNRHGRLNAGQLVVVGNSLAAEERTLNASQLGDYVAALTSIGTTKFDPLVWKKYI